MPQFQFKARDAQGACGGRGRIAGSAFSPPANRTTALRAFPGRAHQRGRPGGRRRRDFRARLKRYGGGGTIDRRGAPRGGLTLPHPTPPLYRAARLPAFGRHDARRGALGAGQATDPGNLRGIIERLHGALVDGRSFSQALQDFPRSFPPLYVNLVQAGEASGALPDILKRLVSHLMAVKSLRDSVQQALLYPAILSLAGAALIILFITVLVPQLTGFLAKTGGSLPLPTRMLIKLNDLVVGYWWLAAMIGFGAFAFYKVFTRTPQGRESWDAFRLKIPGYGRVIKYRFYAQFARTLGTLLHNGVTLLKAVDLLASISENAHLRKQLIAGRAELVEGASLSKAMSRQSVFPALMLDMMAVGEQTGRFADTMQMIADVYERELDKQVKIATALIPLVIIVVIAMLVGAVVFAIMSAVFSITSGLRGRAG